MLAATLAGLRASGGSNQKFAMFSFQNEQEDHSGTISRILVGTARTGLMSLQIVLHSGGVGIFSRGNNSTSSIRVAVEVYLWLHRCWQLYALAATGQFRSA
jgi:hypothetical protein